MGNCVGRQRRERPAAPGHPRKRAGNDEGGSRATGASPVVPLLAQALGFPSYLPRLLAPGFPRWLLRSQTGARSPALVAGGAELGQLRALTRLRAQLAPTGKLLVGVGAGAGNVCRPQRGRRRGGGPGPGRRWPGSRVGVGGWPVGARRGRPVFPRTRSERELSLFQRLSVSLSGCRLCLPESNWQKQRRTLGKKSLFFPQGFLEPPGCLKSRKGGVWGGNRARVCWDPSQPWGWDLLPGDRRGPGSAFSLSWYTPPILALRPGRRSGVRFPGSCTHFLL